jgi:uncharacterized membrane protein
VVVHAVIFVVVVVVVAGGSSRVGHRMGRRVRGDRGRGVRLGRFA